MHFDRYRSSSPWVDRYTKDKKHGTYSQTITNPFIASLRAPEVLTFPKINDDPLHLSRQPELQAQSQPAVLRQPFDRLQIGGL